VKNFVIYCGKYEECEEVARVVYEEPRLAKKIILYLVVDVEGNKHIISLFYFLTCRMGDPAGRGTLQGGQRQRQGLPSPNMVAVLEAAPSLPYSFISPLYC
jgi:hypothetical protein